MNNPNWKRFLSVGLSVFTLFVGSVAMTGCETGEEGVGEEGIEQEGVGEEEIEQEGVGEEGIGEDD